MLGSANSAIRGAICVFEDRKDLIDEAACKLYKSMLAENNISEEDITCLLITQTSDLRSRNPATGLRKGGYCANIALFCMQELEIEGMLSKVIRMLCLTKRTIERPRNMYLDGAEQLRPDLVL
jgi:chorismate mutase